MDYYLDQPVRRPIAEEIDICTSIAVHTGGRGLPALTREQFDGCLRSMVDLAADQASREELAGDPDGPFGPEQLRREMMMPPWQRVNFALGYLHEQYPSSCSPPQAPVSNPLEWSGLATMLAWFARQEPVFLQTPENEALILEMRRQGTQLLQDVLQQVDCVAGAGTGVNDPIVRSLADYQRALDAMVAGLRQAELEFRASRLSPGADVVLHGNADQRTAYRSEDMTIGPCDRAEVCEMGSELEATRALIGLFPNPYLVADQTRLGTIEICYTNMRWVERRSEPVRPDDPYVANYFGRLSFDLIGRYRHGDEARTVFGANFVSPEEYHYLFAAATEEVLADDCPTEWVGSRIVTGLGKTSGIRVVPDRLTYLAAARTRPSEVIAANWSRGAQWRDWFVTGLGVEPLSIEADEGISDRIDRHLQSLYQAEQSTLYNALLRPPTRAGGSKLNELQEDLTARKALVRAYMQLFYPRHMIDSDDIRGSLEGRGSLLDLNMLRRFREEGVAVSSINAAGIARMERLETVWNRQPEVERRSGSVAVSVAHAVTRLNDLHHEFFVSPRSAPEPGYGDLRPGAPNR
jgi:hypothetical protein